MVAANTTTIETGRNSSVATAGKTTNPAKKALRAMAAHLKEHHQSVNAAFGAFYNVGPQMQHHH
jgi:hypothetical protein